MQNATRDMSHPTGPHDVGGHPAPMVEKDEHQHALWERRVDAMMMLLTHPSRKLLILDELRRNVEALGPGAYSKMNITNVDCRDYGRHDRSGCRHKR